MANVIITSTDLCIPDYNTTHFLLDYALCVSAPFFKNNTDLYILKGLTCYVAPVIAFVALILNFMSLSILKLSGLDKPSNIFLFSLTLADTMALAFSLDYTYVIGLFGPNKRYPTLGGFQYGNFVDYLFVYTNLLLNFMGFWGLCTNGWIPVIITMERLLAIFKPLSYKRIISAKTSLAIVLAIFLIWLQFCIYRYSTFTVESIQYLEDFHVVTIRDSRTPIRGIGVTDAIFLEILISIIPVSLVASGCLILSVKIKSILKTRQELTVSKTKIPWSARTTRTLLATCLFFVVGNLISDVIVLLNGSIIRIYLVYEVIFIILALISCSNFFIYMICNPKLAQLFIQKLCVRYV